MSYLSNRAYTSKSVSSVIYSDMHGVDFSGDGSEISRHRFSYLENMYRDYDGDGAGAVESIPGFRRIAKVSGKANGLFSYRNAKGEDVIVAHISDKIYTVPVNKMDALHALTYVCDAANNESRAFRSNGSLYILDGENIIRVCDGFAGKIGDTGGGIYVPTTYINGKEHEQRNLLTRSFREKTVLASASSHALGSDEIKYVITDAEKKTCKAVGLSEEAGEELYIPSRTKIANTYYSVTEIEAKAFANASSVKQCRIAEGVRHVGNLAFWGCTSLESVILPNSLVSLGNGVFTDCTSLSELHLGGSLQSVGANVISMCGALKSIGYAKDSVEFSKIDGKEAFGDRTVEYDVVQRSIDIGIEIYSPAVSVSSVTVDDETCEFRVYEKGGLCKKIAFSTEDGAELEGKTVVIEGVLSSLSKDYRGVFSGFLSSRFNKDGEVDSVIKGCTVAESFDGRIFITGNPDYPGVCFYSALDSSGENNPLYFGELNYFCDGGSFGNTALLSTGDNLAVFKAADDGGGSIYYHASHDTGIDIIPKIYPVTSTHSGVISLSEAKSFFDDPVFITERGLCALDRKQINLERSVSVRSHNVNPKLLTEELGKIKLAVWRGYLAVAINGRIYLADSRDTFRHGTGSVEYEWYYLDGVGSWSGGERVYRYSPIASEGLEAHPDADGVAQGTVYSRIAENGTQFYTVENDVYYEVYPTDEYTGGTFHPIKQLLSVKERLFFLTDDGTFMVFNNDMRGVIPTVLESIYTDKEEREAYLKALGRRIHPYFYSFDDRAPRYAMVTAKDNCGIPHLEKNTVKNSLTVKCRALSSATLRCEVGTDREGYSEICRFPGTDFSFGDMNFSSLTFSTTDVYTVPVSEKTKGWVEKQISLFSDGFRCPFGVYTVAYRFSVRGRIKKNR